MAGPYRIHRLNTGWLESMAGVSLMGEGRTPAVVGGQLRSYGYTEEIRRPDGSLVAGTMVPAPAWYIEGGEQKILVDTGTGSAEEVIEVQSRYGDPLATITAPEDQIASRLGRIGVAPEEIDVVVHTHLHFDHVGGNELFPNATFLVNGLELPWALCPPPYGVYYYREFGHHVRSVLDQIEFVEGDREVAPGIRMVHTGGHSPGHSVLFVETEVGRAVIGGDAVYNYRNLEYEWPQGPLFDVAAARRAIQIVKSAEVILLNHDPLFERLFPGDVIGAAPLPPETAAYMERLRSAGAFPLEGYDPAYSPVAGS